MTRTNKYDKGPECTRPRGDLGLHVSVSNICTVLLKCGAVSLVYHLPSLPSAPGCQRAVDTVPAPNCTFYVKQSTYPLSDVGNILDDDA